MQISVDALSSPSEKSMWKKEKLSKSALIEHVHLLKPDLRLLSIVPTFKCDCRCKFCHIWGDRGWAHSDPTASKSIDLSMLTNFILDALKQNGKPFFAFLTGGEPLLYNEIDALLAFLSHHGIKPIIATNGSKTSKHAESIVRNAFVLSTSLDGPPTVHNSARQHHNVFEKACDGIEQIIKAKQRLKSATPFVAVNCVLSKYNTEHVASFWSVLKDRFKHLNVNFAFETMAPRDTNSIAINFEPVLFTTKKKGRLYSRQITKTFGIDVSSAWEGFCSENIIDDVTELTQFLSTLWEESCVDTSRFVDLASFFENLDNVFGRVRCRAPWHELRIRPNGNTYFCPDFPDYCLGNIAESSFSDLWLGTKAKQFREMMQKRLLPVCNRCCRLFQDYEAF